MHGGQTKSLMALDRRFPQVMAMSRRRFLEVVGAATLVAACGPAAAGGQSRAAQAATAPPRVRAVAFDLFTLFDPRGVEARVAEVVGAGSALAATWKTRLFEYCWIRAAAGQYVDFERLVKDSLAYAAATHGVALGEAARARLEAVFTELSLWPDTAATLSELKQRGLRLAPLANYAPRMIERLLRRAGIREMFEDLVSTDRARTYKPDPRAYALAETAFGLGREEIAFAAFGGWDAAGAKWHGYPTFWVNRFQVAPEELVAADDSGADLTALAAWLATRPSPG
jgi:2-haloacid dehalogenase